jgi:hypothetical protein
MYFCWEIRPSLLAHKFKQAADSINVNVCLDFQVYIANGVHIATLVVKPYPEKLQENAG